MPHDISESLRLRRARRVPFGAGIHSRKRPPAPARSRDLGDGVLLDLPNGWDIHDQGARGACVAHAAVACLEYFAFKTTGILTPLSEQFVHFQMRKEQLQQGIVSDRTWLAEAAHVLKSQGICLQSECLYDPFLGPLGADGAPPSPEAIKSAKTRKFRTTVIDRPEDHDISPATYVVDHLRTGFPVAVSIPVRVLPASSGLTNWTKRLARFHGIVADPDGECAEGHAVCIVGYMTDAEAAGGGWLVCRNSWGLEWASEAHAEQPFAIKRLPGRGYGVMSVGYLDTLCSEVFTVGAAME
jgi:hypothetical protein